MGGLGRRYRAPVTVLTHRRLSVGQEASPPPNYSHLHSLRVIWSAPALAMPFNGDPDQQQCSWPRPYFAGLRRSCLLYTSDAADEEDSGDLGGRGITKKIQ